ncbi:Asp-tRNA(Asn)/Glu-tRNA(Gln) amidotransferase subunit GatC [Thiomicrospira microaerophila]|uniref:Asp-tRNA(Asn)/Glu-tRNA(Gln) amidotransferase subunit GatC n=1 Tax=Thiomicrospira microaerophila TaxID=406020 RepID=UPI0005C8AC6C|nr:Asp-tRNA(Asn)/Glu-tRNA(Gln) amidotransferase subunit GatC [Thiomicrospira microaerophila]
MSLALAEVKKIAHLAAIAVEPEELDAVGAKLSNILDLFAQLSQADTEGVEPMAHPLDQTQRLREDLVAEVDQRDKFQAIAPATENGLYLVPKVIE